MILHTHHRPITVPLLSCALYEKRAFVSKSTEAASSRCVWRFDLFTTKSLRLGTTTQAKKERISFHRLLCLRLIKYSSESWQEWSVSKEQTLESFDGLPQKASVKHGAPIVKLNLNKYSWQRRLSFPVGVESFDLQSRLIATVEVAGRQWLSLPFYQFVAWTESGWSPPTDERSI